MPIIDQRRIAFDVDARRDILDYLPQAAKTVGLPGDTPTAVAIDASAKSVTFAYGDHLVTLGPEKLAALLITYCIRAGIRIPRQMQRSASFNQETMMLAFLTEYLAAPFPTFRPPQQLNPSQRISRNGA